MKYYIPKKNIHKEDVERVVVFFKNADYFTVDREELYNVFFHFYDELTWEGKSVCPICEIGYVKIKFKAEQTLKRRPEVFLNDEKIYRKNRKEYLENRIINEQGIEKILIFNKADWCEIIKGDVFAVKEQDGTIYIKFRKNDKYGPSSESTSSINLANVIKRNVEKIKFVFANCDYFEVYKEEIVEMQLEFFPLLERNGCGYGRVLKYGHIKLRFSKEVKDRSCDVYTASKRNKKISHLVKRLCSRKSSPVDIASILVTYDSPDCNIPRTEEISVRDVSGLSCIMDEEDIIANYPDYYDVDSFEESWDDVSVCKSGYAKREKDGTVLIKLGRNLPESS